VVATKLPGVSLALATAEAAGIVAASADRLHFGEIVVTTKTLIVRVAQTLLGRRAVA
jgi:hypothetical protein